VIVANGNHCLFTLIAGHTVFNCQKQIDDKLLLTGRRMLSLAALPRSLQAISRE